jgi:hypothetical protein
MERCPVDVVLVHPRHRLLGHDVAEHQRQHPVADDSSNRTGRFAAAAPRALRHDSLNALTAQALERRKRGVNTAHLLQAADGERDGARRGLAGATNRGDASCQAC